jgi:cellulose synthase/poly-beta-1,6-N-acetylglucosamine synthase-like glycosyltransferase
MRLSAIVPATNRPSTLERCVAAIRAADRPPDEVVVVEEAPEQGPAGARNEGARRASGDVLVFVDADVVPRPDAFARIRAAFDADAGLTGVIGSYDDSPPAPGVVAGFRNLLHHHVHQQGAGGVPTFWAGLGALRREAFEAAGGFDAVRYPRPSIEDVELGARLVARGARIVLDPAVQGTHLKAWTLGEMVRTDFAARGVPWIDLLVEGETSTTMLNLGWRHRASALASVVGAGALVLRRPTLAAGSVAALVVLNAPFYALLVRRRGPLEATVGVGLHAVHHLTAVASVPAGALASALRRRAQRSAAP